MTAGDSLTVEGFMRCTLNISLYASIDFSEASMLGLVSAEFCDHFDGDDGFDLDAVN
jgi:hypothetical protein